MTKLFLGRSHMGKGLLLKIKEKGTRTKTKQKREGERVLKVLLREGG